MRICDFARILCLAVLLPPLTHAQEVGSRDLLRHSGEPSTSTHVPEDPEHLKHCENPRFGYADGMTLTKDNKPREIKVELIQISDTNLNEGSEIVATAKLQNDGTQPIEIPWSTDLRTTQTGQDPDNRSWEVGLFQVSLRNKNNQHVDLVSTSETLYGSRFVSGSFLSIGPGEWITAKISFRVTVSDSRYEKLEAGHFDLTLEWLQTSRFRTVKNCSVTIGTLTYDGFHDHKNLATVRRVEVNLAAKKRKSSE